MKLQAANFIHKPLRRNELLDAIGAVLERSVAQRRIADVKKYSAIALSRLNSDITTLSQALGLSTATPSLADPTMSTDQILLASENEHNFIIESGNAQQHLLNTVTALNQKNRLFEEEIFIEPVWRMLLFLLESSLTNQVVYLSNLYNVSGVSPATSGRRVNELRDAGFLIITHDDFDRRRQQVSLTEQALERLTQYICCVASLSDVSTDQ